MVADGCASRPACADSLVREAYLAGPVVASSERRQRRATSGPRALRARNAAAPFSTARGAAVNPIPGEATRAQARAPRVPSFPALPLPSLLHDLPSLTRCSRMYGNVARRAATGVRCRRQGPERSGPASSRYSAFPIISAHQLCIYIGSRVATSVDTRLSIGALKVPLTVYRIAIRYTDGNGGTASNARTVLADTSGRDCLRICDAWIR